MLCSAVSDAEIKQAVFSIDDTKAPGIDGYNSVFFKKTWGIIGGDICKAVREFCTSGKLLKAFNSTAVTLLPKCSNPSSIKEYRPIACSNVVYKAI